MACKYCEDLLISYEESDMDFTPLFQSGNFISFYIEKSMLYKGMKADAVKMVEFVSIKGEEFYFIECKSSFPNPKNPKPQQATLKKSMEVELKKSDPEKSQKEVDKLVKRYFKSDLEINCQDIYTKLHHSIDLLLTSQLKIKEYTASDFPSLGSPHVFNVKFYESSMIFYLILKGFDRSACVQPQIALNDKLKPLKKLWGIQVKVIPEEKARTLGFIQ